MAKEEKLKEEILHEIVEPIIPRFKTKDFLQVVIGASILAVPIGFTEETWNLGKNLPLANVAGLMVLSLVFISFFTYHHYHSNRKGSRDEHLGEFMKRVVGTYFLSFLMVSIILTLIQQAPWGSENLVAFKRAAIVTFPSSLSATIADTLK